MLGTLGPANCEANMHKHGVITGLLCRRAYVGDRCGEECVLLMSKSQSAVAVVSPYVNDALRIESN